MGVLTGSELRVPIAQAGPIYLDVGVGGAQIIGGAPLYGASTPTSPSMGFAANAAAFWNLNKSYSLVQLHFGFSYKLSTSSFDGGELLLQGLYPTLRLETYRFYLSGGVSPLLWMNDSEGAIVGATSLGYFGQAGLLWRIVPFFHIALETTGQFINAPGGMGPKPALDVCYVMRFYLTNPSDLKKMSWDGWRYPFGIDIW